MISINYMQSLFAERDELFNDIATQYETGNNATIAAAVELYDIASTYCGNIQELIDAGQIDGDDEALRIRHKR